MAGRSPAIRVPRAVGWTGGSRWRERLLAFAIFTLAPSIAFWWWFLTGVRHDVGHSYHALLYAMPLASTWLIIGPLLMQQWEFNVEYVLARLEATKSDGGWDLATVRRAARDADRGYWWFVIPMTVTAPVAFWLAYPAYESQLALHGATQQVTGLAVVLVLGAIDSNGWWAAYKSIALVRAATRHVAATWRPFGPVTPTGLAELTRFCWSTAIMFSAGSVSLPALYIIQARLSAGARTIITAFVVLLVLGGLLLYTLPISWLRRLGESQKRKSLALVTPVLARALREVGRLDQQTPAEVQRRWYSFDMAMRLRMEITAQNPVALPGLVTRAATTLILPVLLTVLQILVSNTL